MNVHTVILKDGTLAQRISERRYVACVVVENTLEYRRRKVAHAIELARKTIRWIRELRIEKNAALEEAAIATLRYERKCVHRARSIPLGEWVLSWHLNVRSAEKKAARVQHQEWRPAYVRDDIRRSHD